MYKEVNTHMHVIEQRNTETGSQDYIKLTLLT